MKTITIAGGGLAGLSLGIGLRRAGIPVILHEAGIYPRHRVCGEFISGVSTDTLRQLGIEDLFAEAHQLRTTEWHLRDRVVLTRALPEAALGISRFRLDQKLADRFVEEGGELQTQSRFRESSAETGVVWAGGRNAVRDSPWLGLKVHARKLNQSSDLEMHLGDAGYVGLAPVENGAVNVCGLFKRRPIEGAKGAGLLLAYLKENGLGSLASRLENAELDENSFQGVSAFSLGRQSIPPGRCTIGDAESIIPPFTGNGMTMALQGAALATAPLQAYARADLEWTSAAGQVRRLLRARFRRRLFASRMLHPFLLSAAGQQFLSVAGSRDLLPFEVLYRFLR